MRSLLAAVLATAWVLEVIWLQRIRRHPYERPDHIDRDFRDMVAHVTGEGRWPGWPYKTCRAGGACHGKGVHLVRHYPLEYANGARAD